MLHHDSTHFSRLQTGRQADAAKREIEIYVKPWPLLSSPNTSRRGKERERHSISPSQYQKRSSGNERCKSGRREARNVQNDYQRNFCGVYHVVEYHINIDVRTDVNQNKVLLVSSTYATRFGRADPQAIKYTNLKHNKNHAYFTSGSEYCIIIIIPWSRVLENLIDCLLAKDLPHFVESEGSLPHSQIPATCTYPESDRSSLSSLPTS